MGQARQCFAYIITILAEANAKPEHVVRITWYVNNRDEYLNAGKSLGVAYREFFDKHYPVMAVIGVEGFVAERAKMEMEATAIIPD